MFVLNMTEYVGSMLNTNTSHKVSSAIHPHKSTTLLCTINLGENKPLLLCNQNKKIYYITPIEICYRIAQNCPSVLGSKHPKHLILGWTLIILSYGTATKLHAILYVLIGHQ